LVRYAFLTNHAAKRGHTGGAEGNTLVGMLATMEASCPLERIEYVEAFNWGAAFPDDASLQQLPGLTQFLHALQAEVERRRTAAAHSAAEAAEAEAEGKGPTEPEEELCSICYASPLDTTLLPCKHQSCRRCINRQMLNSARCFFCNATVEELATLPPPPPPPEPTADQA
jgi:Kip1 ubiquitination-promoting complex protein 1